MRMRRCVGTLLISSLVLTGCNVTIERGEVLPAPAPSIVEPAPIAAPVPSARVAPEVERGPVPGSVEAPLKLREALRTSVAAVIRSSMLARAADAGPLSTIAVTALYDLDTTERLRATMQADRQLPSMLREIFDGRPIAMLRPGELANVDWILVGGLRPAAALRDDLGQLRAVPLCIALLERASALVIGRQVMWVGAEGLDLAPAAFHLDFPLRVRRAVALDANTLCGVGTDGSSTAETGYLFSLESLVAVDEAIGAYEAGSFAEATRLFAEEMEVGGAESLLPLAGSATSLARQQRLVEARKLLEQWVRIALHAGPIVFGPPPASRPVYEPRAGGFDPAGWHYEAIRAVASEAARMRICLTVSGFPASTIVAAPGPGDPALQRAARIRTMLLEDGRLRPSSVVVVTTVDPTPVRSLGSHDARDRWDRRIEVILRGCR